MTGADIAINIEAIAEKQIEAIVQRYSTATTLVVVAGWLDVDTDTALDWLVAKVSAFRGISESDAREMMR